MGTGPSTPGVRRMTVGESVQGMPHRTIHSNSEMNSKKSNSLQDMSKVTGEKETLQITFANKASILERSQRNGIGKEGASENSDRHRNASDKLKNTTVETGKNQTDDKSSASSDINENKKMSEIQETKDNDEGNSGEGKKIEKLTPEEVAERKKKYVAKMEETIASMSTIPPRRMEEDGAPFTKEFRTSLLALAKSYFQLKVGVAPYSEVYDYRQQVGKVLFKGGTATLLCDVLANTFDRRDFMNDEGKMVSDYWLPMKNILLTLMNYSDAVEVIKACITEHPSLLQFMSKFLDERLKLHLNKETTENQDKILIWCLSIIHNCGSSDENVPRLRDLGIIQVILPYLDSSSERIRLTSIATLADLVNEKESELLGTHVTIFNFIISKLRKALKHEDHKDLGWSAEELTRAIGRLARNDANKKILVEKGCLPPLVEVLKVGSNEEIKEALSCLWVLTFDDGNKQKMVDEPELVQEVYNMYLTSEHSKKHSCQGILWSMREQLLASETCRHIGDQISNIKSTASPKQDIVTIVEEVKNSPIASKIEGHVMISYQWANQEVIKKIAQELRAHGIPVWLDVDYMGGSTLQAMAQAVEDSFIVIIAMSQKYKDSPNTRAEAEYAFQQRKKIIPLIMQKNYRPDGWLGLILGSKLYYDFSGKYSFESRMEGLLKAIMTIVNGDSKDSTDQPLIPTRATLSLAPPPRILPMASPVSSQPPQRQIPKIDENAIKNWTKADVTKWLSKHKLENSTLSYLGGEEIVFLHNLKFEAPEFFYNCLERKLQLTSILQLAQATKALTDLTL